MIKKIFFVILALAVIGAIVPDTSKGNSANTTQDSESTVETEEAASEAENKEAEEQEDKDTEESKAETPEEKKPEKKEEVIYTKEKYVNDYIVKYNRLYPDNMVELDMVDYWLTGGGNYATTVTFDEYVIDFGEADGYPMYHIWTDNGIDEDNKDAFIDEAMKWIDVILELSDENMEVVRRNLSLDKSEISFNLPRNYLIFKENGSDHHLDYHDYIITIGTLRQY